MNTLLIFYALFCLLVFVFQRKLQYFPSKNLHSLNHYHLTDFVEEDLVTKDSVNISIWFKEPKNKAKILLYFQGNAGNLGDRAHKFRLFADNSDYGIAALSYRGYGNSKGSPTEEGLLKDAKAATDYLIAKGYNNEDIIFYGESLGSGVAIKHAVKFNPYALILEAPFYSATSIAKRAYWYLPVDLLMKDKFDSYKYAPKIKSSILVFHGTKDITVPHASGELLYEKFKGRKEFISIENSGHLDFDDKFLIDEINKFF